MSAPRLAKLTERLHGFLQASTLKSGHVIGLRVLTAAEGKVFQCTYIYTG